MTISWPPPPPDPPRRPGGPENLPAAPAAPPPPPAKKSRAGLVVGLVVGGIVLLALLVVAGAAVLVAVGSEDSVSSGPPASTAPRLTTSTSTPPSDPSTTLPGGPGTAAAGTGPLTRISAPSAAASLRGKQEAATPDLTVGAITCPPGPYRVGQVVLCQMRLEDADVQYRAAVTGPETLDFTATSPIVDTDKAEELMESKEPGTTADCGAPRVRQLDVGATLACSSASSTWGFTVTPEGDLFGTKR